MLSHFTNSSSFSFFSLLPPAICHLNNVFTGFSFFSLLPS